MKSSEKIIDYDLTSARSKRKLVNLWYCMSGYRVRYLFAILSQGFSTICKTSIYLLLSWVIDNWLILKIRTFPIAVIAAGLLLLAVLEGMFSYFANSTANYTAERIALRIRNNLFNHIQRLSFAYHAKVDTGDLIQRSTSDVDAIRRFFSEEAIGIGRILFLFIINFTAIYRIHPTLAFSTLIIVPLVFLVAVGFFRNISKKYDAYQNQDAVISSLLQENLTGVRVVKAFARQEFEIRKYEQENWKKYQLGKRLLRMEAFFWPSTDLLCGAQMAISFIIGAFFAIDGKISVGNFVAFLSLIIWIIWPIRNMGRIIVHMSRALISFQRVMDIFKEDQEPLDKGSYLPQKDPKGYITLDHVCFAYQNEEEILKDISFSVKPGQVVAIIGSTGSGKSTLMNLLPRFYEYTSGSIKLDDIELNELPRSYLRKHIGIVEQEPFLFSRTIGENIAYGVSEKKSQSEIEEAAKAASIHENILSFKKGYKTMVGERGVTLSGGQKQRIAIARTLLKNPGILIMDDATSSVDADTESDIQIALKNLMRNRTTFIIAHRIQTIQEADLILVMDKGRIIQSGTHQDLINQEGLYQKIFKIQTRIEEELEKEMCCD